jgi:cytochrome P450
MTQTEIPKASFLDSLRYNLAQTFPTYMQGLFTRSRFWVSFWTNFDSDSRAIRAVSRLRSKYGPYVYLSIGGAKTLLVLNHEGVEHVLKNSPAIYASDPDAKRKGMSHFQPDALTISTGAEWKERRGFNEAVLGGGLKEQDYARGFLAVVRRETESLTEEVGRSLVWQDFADAFDAITLQVIFGAEARDDTDLLKRLRKMMREGNRLFALRKSRHFDRFYSSVSAYLERPNGQSLASLSRRTPTTPDTKAVNQIPHWMFAMSETLAANAARALALIVADPETEKRVREEMAQADITTPEGIDKLKYLEACVQEAMRLWPTTPMLIRRTLETDSIGGFAVPRGTQVLINNTFNHRDKETHPFADKFEPELWLEGAEHNYFFNHLSNGPQVCAGKAMALFIAKAFLASLLDRGRYTLGKPALDTARPLPHMYNYFKLKLLRSS